MKKRINRPFMLIMYGPTGVGKTDMALAIAQKIPVEIINMDMGQFYTPLSIGTAKPDWKNSPVPHHLFDIIDSPINYTVTHYRTSLYKKVTEVIERGNLPIIVGGSAFYLHSVLFPPQAEIGNIDLASLYPGTTDLWQKLYEIDPKRASDIAQTDTYRIERALSIWHITGKLPSSYAPVYKAEIDFMIVCIDRDRQELMQRINARILEMINQGWVDEAKALIGTPWKDFIQRKGFIGYSEIFDYISDEKTGAGYDRLIEKIAIKTRQYAKRQYTFWRKLEREIKKENRYTDTHTGSLETVNLTDVKIDLYINELLQRLPLH